MVPGGRNQRRGGPPHGGPPGMRMTGERARDFKGTMRKLMDYLNALHVDHIVMETAHRPADELAAFRDLRPEIGLGLGVIDVKATQIESPDAVARAIERAEMLLGPGRIKYVHPDCGFWMLKRSIADGKMRAMVEGRNLYEGRRGARAA